MATVYWRVGRGDLIFGAPTLPSLIFPPNRLLATIASPPPKANSLLLGIGEWKGRVCGQGFLLAGEMGVE